MANSPTTALTLYCGNPQSGNLREADPQEQTVAVLHDHPCALPSISQFTGKLSPLPDQCCTVAGGKGHGSHGMAWQWCRFFIFMYCNQADAQAFRQKRRCLPTLVVPASRWLRGQQLESLHT